MRPKPNVREIMSFLIKVITSIVNKNIEPCCISNNRSGTIIPIINVYYFMLPISKSAAFKMNHDNMPSFFYDVHMVRCLKQTNYSVTMYNISRATKHQTEVMINLSLKSRR